jgi:hypothetical protein
MTEPPVPLIEISFVQAIAIIAAADELPEQTRRHWATSLRQIAKALDQPLEVIPARYSAVRAELAQLHQIPAGLTAKTLQNHIIAMPTSASTVRQMASKLVSRTRTLR